MQVVKVDDLRAQPRQSFLEGMTQGRGPAVDDSFAIDACHPAFRRQGEFVPAMANRLTDQGFVRAKAIERGGVEEIIAEIERAIEQADGILSIGGMAVGVAQRHAAEANCLDAKRADVPLHAASSDQ